MEQQNFFKIENAVGGDIGCVHKITKSIRKPKVPNVSDTIKEIVNAGIFWWAVFVATYEYGKNSSEKLNIRIILDALWAQIKEQNKVKNDIELRKIIFKFIGDNKLWNFRFKNKLLRASKDTDIYIGFLFENLEYNNLSFRDSTLLAETFIKDPKSLENKQLALLLYVNYYNGDIVHNSMSCEVLERLKSHSLRGNDLATNCTHEIMGMLGFNGFDNNQVEVNDLFQIISGFSDIISNV